MADDIYSLAMGQNSEVRSYSGCIVNGVRFHTTQLDNRRTTQNSRIFVLGESEGDQYNFYGVLDEVLDFQYVRRRCVMMLKCRWFDTDPRKKKIAHRSRVDIN